MALGIGKNQNRVHVHKRRGGFLPSNIHPLVGEGAVHASSTSDKTSYKLQQMEVFDHQKRVPALVRSTMRELNKSGKSHKTGVKS